MSSRSRRREVEKRETKARKNANHPERASLPQDIDIAKLSEITGISESYLRECKDGTVLMPPVIMAGILEQIADGARESNEDVQTDNACGTETALSLEIGVNGIAAVTDGEWGSEESVQMEDAPCEPETCGPAENAAPGEDDPPSQAGEPSPEPDEDPFPEAAPVPPVPVPFDTEAVTDGGWGLEELDFDGEGGNPTEDDDRWFEKPDFGIGTAAHKTFMDHSMCPENAAEESACMDCLHADSDVHRHEGNRTTMDDICTLLSFATQDGLDEAFDTVWRLLSRPGMKRCGRP